MSQLDDKLDKLLKQQGLEDQAPPKPNTSKKTGSRPVKKRASPAAKKKKKAAGGAGKKAAAKKKTTKHTAKKKSLSKKVASAKVDPELFAHRYIQYHCNATAAYLSIRPEAKDTTAAANGHKMLRKAEVQNVLWPLLEGLLEREQAQSEWVIKRWLEQAEASPLDYFSIKADGSLGSMDLSNISPAQKRNLRSIKYNRSTVTKEDSEVVNESWTVTVVDQQKAVELLAKMLGMLQPKMDKETEDRIGDLLEAGVKRITRRMDPEAWRTLEGEFSEVG